MTQILNQLFQLLFGSRDICVVIDISDHHRRYEITADLFHYARQIDSLIEPKCVFWDEYKNYDKASILAEIIKTASERPLIAEQPEFVH